MLIIDIAKILKDIPIDEYNKVYYNIVQQATNMDLMIDFNFSDASFEQILFFTNKFFTDTKTLKYIISLVQIVSDVIIYSINNNYKNTWTLPTGIIKGLSEQLKDHIENIKEFLNGIPLFMLTSLSGFIESNSNEHNSSELSNSEKFNLIKEILIQKGFEVIDDIDYFPRNTVCLFYNNNFLIDYYSLVPFGSLNKKYFIQQYQGYIYNGMNLMYYFSNPENMLYHVVSQAHNGENKEFLNALNIVYKKF
jgi:hypothetical protein